MRIPFFSAWREDRKVRDFALTALVHSDTQAQEKLNELLKLSRRRELLVVAARSLAEQFNDKDMAEELSPHFCVDQLDSVVGLLRAAGCHEAAQWWAEANGDYLMATGDQDEDQADADHALYLATGNPFTTVV
ncbi:hypothetical protein ACWEVY_28800 [Streptomyces longwoodensis]